MYLVPICLLPWLPGKAESRPKASRKRPRSAAPGGKRCERKSTKSGEATATGTARLIFAKVQNVQSLDRQSELKATDAPNTSNTSNGLVAVSNEAKEIDSSLPNFGGKESLAALPPAEAAVSTDAEPKEQDRDGQEGSDSRIQNPIAESNESAEPTKSKKQKCETDGTSILSLLTSGAKAQDQSLATAPTSQSSEAMEAAGKTCDEPCDTHSDVPLSSIGESRPEGRMPATPMQNGDSNPSDQDETKPESGTKIQPGGHVTRPHFSTFLPLSLFTSLFVFVLYKCLFSSTTLLRLCLSLETSSIVRKACDPCSLAVEAEVVR